MYLVGNRLWYDYISNQSSTQSTVNRNKSAIWGFNVSKLFKPTVL